MSRYFYHVFLQWNEMMKTSFLLSPLTHALFLALVFTGAGQLHAAERQAKFLVTQQQMQALNIQTQALQADGQALMLSLPAKVTLADNREQVISTPLAGLVTQLLVQRNQAVKKGQALIKIASPELGSLQLQLMQAHSRVTLARQNAKRERALFAEGIIAERRVQEAQAALSESEAALGLAKAQLRLAGLASNTIERIANTGKLEDSLTLLAPQAGMITEFNIKPGQRVEPASALLHLAQTDQLALEIQAPAGEAASWQVGAQLRVQGQTATARIVARSAMVGSSQTFAIRAVLDANPSNLRPGELVTVMLPLGRDAASWDVPLAALVHDGKQAYVFIRSADNFEARAVTVTSSAGQRVRITGPLKAGEQIAVSGVVALKGSWLGEKGAN
jgi:RND family efflux transporter MFP subunit